MKWVGRGKGEGEAHIEEVRMAQCEVCDNEYDKVLRIRLDADPGVEHVFDSFECAIHALAVACERCGCRVIGHGIESDGRYFCCAHCARGAGVEDASDRAD